MKTDKLIDAIGDIDDKIITEAENPPKSRKMIWVKWVAVAACFCIVVSCTAVMIPVLMGRASAKSREPGMADEMFMVEMNNELPDVNYASEINGKYNLQNDELSLYFHELLKQKRNESPEVTDGVIGTEGNPDIVFEFIIKDYGVIYEYSTAGIIHCRSTNEYIYLNDAQTSEMNMYLK